MWYLLFFVIFLVMMTSVGMMLVAFSSGFPNAIFKMSLVSNIATVSAGFLIPATVCPSPLCLHAKRSTLHNGSLLHSMHCHRKNHARA